jgi:drug/metabolite transporter (DMT)-like permease
LGFCGDLLLVRPSAEGFDRVSLVALLAAALVAARDLLTRKIGAETPSSIVSLTSTVAVALCALALAPYEQWAPIRRVETLYLAAAALLVTCGTMLVIAAYRHGDVGVVSGYRYAIAVFAVGVGYLVWGDIPDLVTTLGIATIIGSGLYTMHRQRVRPDSQLRLPSTGRT